MAYIYQIVNDINNKKYIGQTAYSLEKRFAEHCRAALKDNIKNRPLYNAMQKYGSIHFSIELIEETIFPNEREQYWIQYYDTYKNGYNATLGGEGRLLLDHNLILQTYEKYKNAVKVALELKVSKDTVIDILHAHHVPIVSSSIINRQANGKAVVMWTLDKIQLKIFETTADAARYLIDAELTHCKFSTIRYHISEVCNGKRKSAAGYYWTFLDKS